MGGFLKCAHISISKYQVITQIRYIRAESFTTEYIFLECIVGKSINNYHFIKIGKT